VHHRIAACLPDHRRWLRERTADRNSPDKNAALAANRAQFYLDFASGPFYGFNRPNALPGGDPELVAPGHDGWGQALSPSDLYGLSCEWGEIGIRL